MSAVPAAASVSRFGRGEWTTLAVIAVLGLVTVPQPFAWDQAMFTLGARKLAAGAVLYRDYWDPKQPGLFAFYWLGGKLFGFSEIGIHLFELVWMLAFAIVLMGLVGARYGAAVGRLAAALSVGLFFAVAYDALHAQIECLAGLPLLLALWAAVRAGETTGRAARWLALSGLAGGIALLFKVLLAPILLGFWIVALVDGMAARGAGSRGGAIAIVRCASAIALGAMIPLGAGVAYFAAHHSLAIAWWTTFVYPLAVMREVRESRLHTLFRGALWFARHWAPVVGAAIVGVLRSRGLRDDRFAFGLLVWLGTGQLVFLAQRLSYWPYHFLIFIVPLAIFGALGLRAIAGFVARRLPSHAARAGIAAAFALIAFAPTLGPWGREALTLARDHFALTPDARARHFAATSVGGVYPKVRSEVAFLSEPGALPGPIWVIGNPLYYWLSGRDQAVPRNGGSFIQYASVAEWEGISASLEQARPAYIYVHSEYGSFLDKQRDRAASFFTVLHSDYAPVRLSARGLWYARLDRGREEVKTP